MIFEFATASKIIFGVGKLNIIDTLFEEYPHRLLIVSGAPQEILDRLIILLDKHKVSSSVVRIDNEPTIDVVREVVELSKQTSSNLVIGIGGGSAIDTAKSVAALSTNPGDVTDYLEVIGSNRPLTLPPLPLIAIPTTSGTGSEVTRNAVIGSPIDHVKVSLRSHLLLPRIALVDPELTLRVPPFITAITGLDALTQLIEPFTSNSSNPITDALCLEGIKRIAHSLFQAYDDGKNINAREDMSVASLFSGLALANAKLGAVHGLAGPISGEIAIHHGAICASLLANVMAENLSALINRSPDHPALGRYALVGKLLSGDPDATGEIAIQWINNFCLHAQVKPLSYYGLTETQFTEIIRKSLIASSMKGNPITLTDNELRNILQRSL